LAYYWLGKTYYQTGEFLKAEKYYRAFLEKINSHSEVREASPIEGDGFYGLAEIQEKQKNDSLALELYDKAIKSWIDHYGAGGRDKIIACLHKKGELLLRLQKADEALKSYHEALSFF
jgi:tetratricopeptide (TPR) repeat protein